MAKIKTAAGDLDDGKYYDLTLKHGASTRLVKNAKVHAFEQVERVYDDEGVAVGKVSEIHYEVAGLHQNKRPEQNKSPEEWESYEEELTIGFLPEHVIEAKPSKMN